ncbi:MAG: 9-O-acetylesterase [Bacteroidetes bacterium GWF2_42_66]|nr:MAG: 9-O-acetylesterase [Bacteroidetes bacterium GWA2_42_15]OFY00359.1 MAG: 9-O-acetylesterase [Bacteroidetes bacterium GWE2_42_39]OFY47071.1 MAG: 9-O-acetylesterase [Bacteroidetes bacterium GWF2_42_66]HBL76762.1 sialate O-acetylesterase [Prolixibacteraceae bacterium]HCU62857.1 sialate O-acetylesterase [Prolixibacteraceae bacterium]
MRKVFNFLRLSVLFLTVLSFSASGEIKLPFLFGDNMVLQQQAQVKLWGKATPQKTIAVTTSWNNKKYIGKSGSDGSWSIKIATPQAGGPYQIIISDSKRLVLDNVLIGEVWFCSGQSNMGMTLKGGLNSPVFNSNASIANSANKSIRLFTVGRKTSLEPVSELQGIWKECEPGTTSGFSAVAYFFGEMLQRTLKVPVGLINSSWGGTTIEAWMGENGIKKFDFVTFPNKTETEKLNEKWPKTPSILFNGMVNPMKGFSIRGVIWYQGEDNVRRPEQYMKLMQGLVENWREEWAIGNFPFYYVQIAPFEYGPNNYGPNINSAFLREAQLKASSTINNSGMVCLLDAGEKDNIHPGNKKVVGERLAYLSLSGTYGMKGIQFSGPVLKEMVIEGRLVNLTFDHAENGLTSFGKELENFEVAGKNKQFYPAKAFITKEGVTLFSELVAEPVAVRYAFKNFVTGDLYNTEGLPASSFRTDTWDK